MMLETLLVMNFIWFGLGFHAFSLRSRVFAKMMVPKDYRDTPAFEVLVASGRFLGGFNLAFALLCFLLVWNLNLFPDDAQRGLLLLVIAVAHGTQFAFNVPIALQNRHGGGAWKVTGKMLFIFVVDLIMTLLNLMAAILLLL